MPRDTLKLTSKIKLLKAAQGLFAAKGFRDVSVREIAAAARVNSALVGYYFGGKQALFNEVYRAQAMPLAGERMRQLEAVTRNRHKPSVEEILKAWLLPWLRLGSEQGESALHLRMTANISRERWMHARAALPAADRTHAAFVKALRRCLPHLTREEVIWRLHFLTGAFTFGVRVPGALTALSRGRCNPNDLEEVLRQMLPFAVAGFCAPAPSRGRR
mgnify:CR=1 FL=1